MSVGQTSAFNKTFIRILTSVLVVNLFPGVSAYYCYYDEYGYEYCDGSSALATGAIAGIAIGGILISIGISLGVWAYLRRRRLAQTNVIYAPATTQAAPFPPAQQAPGTVYGSPYGGGQPQYTPQYPYPAQTGVPPHAYGPNPGYAQNAGLQPQQYAHPASPQLPQPG